MVSISIGDSAEFVYGDQRDLEKAEKVVLESGDVLIFGGSSRHIFHGVTTINAETAPKSLLEESNLNDLISLSRQISDSELLLSSIS
ncbi:hypothetical protein Leryth_010197 [Lithospermum erythrorhizon]|nr:hypothetical protein Leryth_010197 [Lithospermum erythrorhizon]